MERVRVYLCYARSPESKTVVNNILAPKVWPLDINKNNNNNVVLVKL